MDRQKIAKIISVALIAGGVGAAYYGGASESSIVAMVGVVFGVIAAIVAFLK